jgi:hypothetical protein
LIEDHDKERFFNFAIATSSSTFAPTFKAIVHNYMYNSTQVIFEIFCTSLARTSFLTIGIASIGVAKSSIPFGIGNKKLDLTWEFAS